jgi:glycosyltransferase involved in cell wall biosynthesis
MDPTKPRRPRVVHVINALGVGGAETMVARLVGPKGAARFEHRVLPLIEGGGIASRVRDAGALSEALGVDGAANLLTSPVRLAGRLRRLRPDIVQGWLIQGNLAATVGVRLGRVDAPVLWNVRWALYDMENERRRTRALMALSARLAPHQDRIVFNSRLAVTQHAAIGFPPDRARLIPNGFDLEALRPDPEARASVREELRIPASASVIGMLARHHPMKDHAVSLRAAARVVERGVDAEFVYAGPDVDAANAPLNQLVRELGLTDRVRLLGERHDVARLYASFDLYWMSSWARGIAEGFPNVVAEAMACGVPCVATDVGDAAWIIGDTGRVVPPRDPAALGDAAADFIGHGAETLRRSGLEARARIARDFSLAAAVEAYEALYTEVLEARQRR